MTTQASVQGAENEEQRYIEKIKLAQHPAEKSENCNEFASGQEPGNTQAHRSGQQKVPGQRTPTINEASDQPEQSMDIKIPESESDDLTGDGEGTHSDKHTNNGDGAGEIYTQNENGGEIPMDQDNQGEAADLRDQTGGNERVNQHPLTAENTVDEESGDQTTDPMGKAAVDADVGDAASKTEYSANLENQQAKLSSGNQWMSTDVLHQLIPYILEELDTSGK